LNLAKKYHPDRTGQVDAETFKDVQEAYEVLSDPERRRHYNHELDLSETGTGANPAGVEPVSIFSRPQGVRPSFEELHERWLRNFTGLGVPKGERIEGLNIEILLSAEEAMKGCVAPIEVPSFHRCPFCDGTGYEWVFPCSYCFTEGVVENTETVRVDIPPSVEPGTVFEIPIDGLGIHNFYLRLHILVE
jgi:DnaJ-class molecular chaperone